MTKLQNKYRELSDKYATITLCIHLYHKYSIKNLEKTKKNKTTISTNSLPAPTDSTQQTNSTTTSYLKSTFHKKQKINHPLK